MTAHAPRIVDVAVALDVEAARAARFDAIFDEHHDAAWRTLRRLGVPEAHVDDGVQRVFVIVARRMDGIEPGGESRYVYGVALRVASEMRRRDPSRREVSGDAALAALADDAPGPEESLLEHEARRALDEALGAMPDDLRE
ncbi:MAG TPA: sigma-70 family RNA polymerase sigma factor, partial [Labilithrix sp.]